MPGTAAARKQRVDAHLELVRKIAGRLRTQLPGHFDIDDLVGYGTEGLIQAAERYDERSTTPFPLYAYYRIRGSMLDGVRRMGLKRSQVERWRAEERATVYLENLAAREEGAAPVAPTLEDDLRAVLAALQGVAVSHLVSMDVAEEEVAGERAGAEELMALGQTRARVKAALDELPERERVFVHKLYYEGKSLTQAASEVKISLSWASRLHARAIELLRAALVDEDT